MCVAWGPFSPTIVGVAMKTSRGPSEGFGIIIKLVIGIPSNAQGSPVPEKQNHDQVETKSNFLTDRMSDNSGVLS